MIGDTWTCQMWTHKHPDCGIRSPLLTNNLTSQKTAHGMLQNMRSRILSSAGVTSSCVLPIRVPNPSPTLDKDLASIGPAILSSIGGGVWRKAPETSPDSNTTLDTFQSARIRTLMIHKKQRKKTQSHTPKTPPTQSSDTLLWNDWCLQKNFFICLLSRNFRECFLLRICLETWHCKMAAIIRWIFSGLPFPRKQSKKRPQQIPLNIPSDFRSEIWDENFKNCLHIRSAAFLT